MRGGISYPMKLGGNCLQPSRPNPGAKWTISTPRPIPVSRDTKVTLISPSELENIRAQINPQSMKTNKLGHQVFTADEWGPPLGKSVTNSTMKIVNECSNVSNVYEAQCDKEIFEIHQQSKENDGNDLNIKHQISRISNDSYSSVARHGGWEQHLKEQAKKNHLPLNTYLGGLKGGSPPAYIKLSNPFGHNLCFGNSAFQALANVSAFLDYFTNIIYT